MMNRFNTSWQLVKASWAVLQSDKELIVFPIISGIVMTVIMLVFLIPIGLLFGLLGAASGSEAGSDVLGYVALFLFYLVSYSISIYFNVALVGAVMIRLDGGDPTVRDGLRVANGKLGIIVQYAMLSATVGVILRFIEERLGVLGWIISWLGGLAWTIATFLVIPILAVKDVGPLAAVQESASLLKKTWGEQLIAGAGMGFVFGLLMMLVMIVGFFLTVAVGAAANSPALILLFLALTVFALIALGVVSSALSGIYQATLYRYAETGVTPDQFDIEAIRGAFREKNKR